jgi:hypothetical protein
MLLLLLLLLCAQAWAQCAVLSRATCRRQPGCTWVEGVAQKLVFSYGCREYSFCNYAHGTAKQRQEQCAATSNCFWDGALCRLAGSSTTVPTVRITRAPTPRPSRRHPTPRPSRQPTTGEPTTAAPTTPPPTPPPTPAPTTGEPTPQPTLWPTTDMPSVEYEREVVKEYERGAGKEYEKRA